MVVGAVQIWKKTLLGHSLAGLLLIKAGVLGTAAFIGQLFMPRIGVDVAFWPALLSGLLGIADWFCPRSLSAVCRSTKAPTHRKEKRPFCWIPPVHLWALAVTHFSGAYL